MFVKALKLSGFKSFADPTPLEFQPGVNVIVGPNGSGKSNIADALSWVLGSQAPSTLRGASMEDVIFAGSQNRPRLGIAEVELTLDNTTGILPIDLAEVTIARTTDRSGVSEYKINGAPCRLLDVAELLSDTGIGKSIHTVVGQGQLDAVLQARPEDRRAFIEEAAQIGKYRRRKDRSLRKIERVDDNLMRLNDVLTELRRSLRPLKRQAGAAAAYSELMGEHRQLRQEIAATEINRLEREGREADPEAEARRAELLGDELAHVRALLSGASDERSALMDAARETRERAYSMRRVADRLASLGRFAQERAARLAARLAAETEEGYRERIRLLERERVRWATAARDLSDVAETAAGRVREADRRVSFAVAEREDAERKLAHARSQETAAAQALVRAEGREAAGRATLGSIEARVHAAAERREQAERELAETARALEVARLEVKALEADLDLATEHAAEAETLLEGAREEADRLRTAQGASDSARAATAARLQALEEVCGLLTDRHDVIALLEPLVNEARGGAEAAALGNEEAEGLRIAADEEVERRWAEVARHDSELRRLDALMAGAGDRLQGAQRRHESKTVELAALDEELARARDSLATAEQAATEERAELPARKAELDDAKSARESADEELAAARARERSAAEAATALAMEARGSEEQALAARLRLEEAEAGIADAEAALAGLEDLRASLSNERDRARDIARTAELVAERARAWATEAERRSEAAAEQADESERRLVALRARERELSDQLEEVSRRRSDAEVRRAETRARIEALAERAMDEWGLGLDELEGALNEEEESAARGRVEELEREMRRIGTVNPRAAEEYEELAERETFLISQIEDLKSSRRDLMRVVREIDETIVGVFTEAYEAVAREFEGVFDRLFPGGSGRLKLLNPEDLLNSGIEIEARPPGKNVRKLSLLSGGERSLVALAFLFAIFRARPSPFYLLDEVEAALDDINLLRFLGLIHELEERAQVLVVTHQKRTMEAADVLYGVTMGKDGVSRVVAKRMEEVLA